MVDTTPAPLRDKVAIITGGGRGIGNGIALTFARHGCTHITPTYASNSSAIEEIASSLHEINSHIKTAIIQADVRDHDFGFRVVDEALKGLEVDRVDIMITNAALVEPATWPTIAGGDEVGGLE